LGVEVEVFDPLRRWEARETQQAGVAPGGGGVDLDAQEPLEELDVGQVLVLVEVWGQRFGRGTQAQERQVGADELVGGVRVGHQIASRWVSPTARP
jgi:hypothetical protein